MADGRIWRLLSMAFSRTRVNRPLDFSGETSRSICSSDFWIDWVILSGFGSWMGFGSSSTAWAKDLEVRKARANKQAIKQAITRGVGSGLGAWGMVSLGLGYWSWANGFGMG